MRGMSAEGGEVPALRDVNQPEYATQMTKALGLQARVPGRLDPEVSVGITLDDYTRPEYWLLRKGSRWQSRRTVAAVVGQRGWWQATGIPGVIAVIESVIITNRFGAPMEFDYGLSVQEAGGAGGGVSSLDDRGQFNKQAPSLAEVFGAGAAPSAPTGGRIIVPNDTSYTLELDAVLTGAVSGASVSCFKVVCAVANAAWEITAYHRERASLPSERV